MNKNLSKIKFFDPKEVRKIALYHMKIFRDRMKAGKNKDGRRFPAYSKGYKEALKRDMRIKRGPRKGERHKGLGGISLTTGAQKIGQRSFLLRGFAIKGLRPRKHGTDYYEIGWDGNDTEIVDWNSEKGRDNVGVPDSEMNKIVNKFGLAVDIQWAKVKNVNVKVG